MREPSASTLGSYESRPVPPLAVASVICVWADTDTGRARTHKKTTVKTNER
jgi:hypothetical protein